MTGVTGQDGLRGFLIRLGARRIAGLFVGRLHVD